MSACWITVHSSEEQMLTMMLMLMLPLGRSAIHPRTVQKADSPAALGVALAADGQCELGAVQLAARFGGVRRTVG